MGIGIVTHWAWVTLSPINHGDWWVWQAGIVRDGSKVWGSWVGHLTTGNSNLQINFFPIYLIAEWIYRFSHSPELASFLVLGLITICAPVILLYLRGPSVRTFVLTLFYSSTTYVILRQTGHIHIAIVYLLAPLILTLWERYLSRFDLRTGLVFSLTFTLGCVYEPRMMIMLALVICILSAGHLKKLILSPQTYVLILLLFGMNIFWISSTIHGSIEYVGVATSRGLFGSNLFDIMRSFTLSEADWTGGYPDQNFNAYPIPIYLWLIPVALAVELYTSHARAKRYLHLAYLHVLLIGIFMSKLSASPFHHVYEWLYRHIPGFNLYREASKWYMMVALGYWGSLSFFFENVSSSEQRTKWHRYLNTFVLCVLLGTSAFNLKPLLTQEIGTTFIASTRPEVYKDIEELYAQDTNYHRILSFPHAVSWITHSPLHPLLAYDSQSSLPYFSSIKSTGNPYLVLPQDKVVFQQILATHSVRYIVVPPIDPVKDSGVYRQYGTQTFFVSYLRSTPHIRELWNKDGVYVFENSLYEAHITGAQVIQMHSPATYVIKVDQPSEVIFRESYHPKWRIYHRDDFDLSPKVDLSIDSTHTIVYGYANRWRVDKPGEYIIHYEPQTYFEKMLRVSAFFAICTVVALIYVSVYRRTPALDHRST